MAESKETIILDFQIEQGDAISELEKAKKVIIGLKEEQASLNKAYKEGKITIDEYASETVRVEQVQKKQTATYSTLTKAVGAQSNSINALTAENKKLREERNNLDITTANGAKRLKEINIQLDNNTDKIKANVSSLEKQKINIGNYASALSGLGKGAAGSIPGLAGLTNGISGVGAGISGLSGPFIAITLAIQVFSEAIKKSEPILDFFEDWFTKISAGVTAFINNISLVGEIIADVFTGNFSDAADKTEQLANAIGDAADESFRLLEATRELEDAELRFRVETAAAANQMKSYVVAAKNKNLSTQESNALLQKASDLENELTDKAVKLAQARADIAEGQLVLSKKVQLEQEGLLRKAGQSQKDYIDSLINSGIFSPEQLEPLISAYEKVEQEASAGLAFQEKVANQQAALREKERADIEKTIALREKEYQTLLKIQAEEDKLLIQKEENSRRQQDLVIKELEGYQERVDAVQAYANAIAASVQLESEQADELDDATLKAIDAGRKRVTVQKDENKTRTELNKLASDTTKLFKENTEASKVTSVALATANTFVGATEALKQPSSLPSPFDVIAKIANVATIIGAGLSAARSITAAAGGGTFMTKGPQLLMVGDNPGGRERVTVEPISGRGKTVVGKNMIKLAGGGVVETQSATGPINNEFAFRSAMNNQPQVIASWKEATELNNRIQFKEALVTA